MPNRRAQRPPRRPALRIGSVNLRGLTVHGRLQAAAALWRSCRYDIVLIQEHHLRSALHDRAAIQALVEAGWTPTLSYSPAGPGGGARGGTGVLLRTALLRSGELVLSPRPQHGPGGRYTALPLAWSGHSLLLCSIYLPNEPAPRVRYITDELAPLAAAAAARGQALLWGGDYNFTPDPSLDRRCPLGLQVPEATRRSDAASQAAFSLLLPSLLDVWRERRKERRSFTFSNGTVFARLDRLYGSASLSPFLSSPTVSCLPTSDHCPVSVTLLGQEPPAVGKPPRWLRTTFLSSPTLAGQLCDWLNEQGLPADPGTLVTAWYPAYKRRLLSKCRELGRAAAQPPAAVPAAAEALDAATRAWEAGSEGSLPALAAARREWRTATHAAGAAQAARLRKHAWLHGGERPSPALTRRLQRPRLARTVAAMRGVGGALHTGTACAQRVADHCAGISAQPAVCPTARAAVLSALSGGRRLSPALAAGLGSADWLRC